MILDHILITKMALHSSLSDSPNHETTKKQEVIAHINFILHAYATAINERRLAWDDPFYLATIDIENFKGTAPRPYNSDQSWKDLRAGFISVVKDCPDYHLRVVSIDTDVDLEDGFSTSFVNAKFTGTAPGVVRNSVAVFRFQRQQRAGDDQGILKLGSWKCIGRELLDGFPVGSGE